jgi:hypothetical protein
MSVPLKEFVVRSKLFTTLLILGIIISGLTIVLNPINPSTPNFGTITVPDERKFNLNSYPSLDRRVIGIYNSLNDFYSVDDFSNESINNIAILPDLLTQYFLAFTVYGLAEIVDTTPSYRTSYYKTLFQKINLMMNSSAMEDFEWTEPGYADDYYNEIGNGYRGPVNIMWTAHMALMELVYYNVFREDMYNNEMTWFMDDWNASLTATTTWDNKTSLDSEGRPLGTWGTGLIPCEPYIVFVQCNAIPFYAMQLYDELFGTNYQLSFEPGMDWWQENMTNEDGIEIDGYNIFPPHFDLDRPLGPSLTAGYENTPKVRSYGSTWSIAFFKAMGLDDLCDKYYEDWKDSFIRYLPNDQAYTPDSYYHPSEFGLYDILANFFACFGTVEMGDIDLYKKLENWFWGPFPGTWDGYTYGFDASALGPRLGPFFEPVLNAGWVWGNTESTLTSLMSPRSDTYFSDTPYIANESTSDGLFIYQAYYDETEEAFILSVEANEQTELTFDQFPNVQGVYRKSGEYSEWTQNGDEMVLTLSPGTYSFVII